MNALDLLAFPAAVLLWLHVALVAVGVLAAPFVLWWAFRVRRKYVEDFERRRGDAA